MLKAKSSKVMSYAAKTTWLPMERAVESPRGTFFTTADTIFTNVPQTLTSCNTGRGVGLLDKVLYWEASPKSPTPYPFIYHF